MFALVFPINVILHSKSHILDPDCAVQIRRSTGSVQLSVVLDEKVRRIIFDTGSLDVVVPEDFGSVLLAKNAELKIGNYSSTVLAKFDKDFNIKYGTTRDRGIIGISYFRDEAVGIDFINRQLSIWKGGNVDKGTVDYWMRNVPYEDNSSIRWVSPGEDEFYKGKRLRNSNLVPDEFEVLIMEENRGRTFSVPIDIAGHRVSALVDTGSANTTISEQLSETLTMKNVGSQEVFGYEGRRSVGVIPPLQFHLGNVRLESPANTSENGESMPSSAVIGMNGFENSKLLFDFHAHRLYIGRASKRLSWTDYWLRYGVRYLSVPSGVYMFWCGPRNLKPADLPNSWKMVTYQGKPLKDDPDLIEESDQDTLVRKYFIKGFPNMKLGYDAGNGIIKNVILRPIENIDLSVKKKNGF